MSDSPFDAIRARLPAPVGLQPRVLALPPRGHHVVLGTAGSGKTTMAMYRALQLADPRTQHAGRTLLVTFNVSLLAYLNHVLEDQTNLDVRNYHWFARGYLGDRGKLSWGCILKDDARRTLISQSQRDIASTATASVLDRDRSFFVQELDWIANHGIRDLASYLVTERAGRGVALGGDARRVIWTVRDRYLQLREAAAKLYDWRDLADAVCQEMAADDTPRRYRHVVIDEGQDFSPQMLRSLSSAVSDDGSVTFFGDVAQQIYGRSVSWRSAGLLLPAGGVLRLTRNHCNSPQIASVAKAIAAMPYYAGAEDMVAPNRFADAGPTPVLMRFDEAALERRWIVDQATRLGALASTGVLFRRGADADLFCRDCPGARKLDRDTPTWTPDPGVWASTVDGAKGFEFQSVIVGGLSDDRWPEPLSIAGDGDEEATANDGRRLYVAVTRARQNLLMTATGELTALLPPNDGLWLERRG